MIRDFINQKMEEEKTINAGLLQQIPEPKQEIIEKKSYKNINFSNFKENFGEPSKIKKYYDKNDGMFNSFYAHKNIYSKTLRSTSSGTSFFTWRFCHERESMMVSSSAFASSISFLGGRGTIGTSSSFSPSR